MPENVIVTLNNAARILQWCSHFILCTANSMIALGPFSHPLSKVRGLPNIYIAAVTGSIIAYQKFLFGVGIFHDKPWFY